MLIYGSNLLLPLRDSHCNLYICLYFRMEMKFIWTFWPAWNKQRLYPPKQNKQRKQWKLMPRMLLIKWKAFFWKWKYPPPPIFLHKTTQHRLNHIFVENGTFKKKWKKASNPNLFYFSLFYNTTWTLECEWCQWKKLTLT